MGNIYANTKTAAKNIGKNISFLQPIFEAIVNSIEAGAKNVNLKLIESEKLDNFDFGYIEGFEIEDDGEGFIDKNRDAFCTLWSENRIKSGGKGSGRFTWLSIYKKVYVHSEIPSTSETVDFIFDEDFSVGSIKVVPEKHDKPKTKLVFTELVKRTLKGKEFREFADIEDLKNQILDHIILRLHYLKKEGKDFSLHLENNKSKITITLNDIPELEKKDFTIKGEDDREQSFQLYYRFINDGKNNKRMTFCADDRAIKTFDGDGMNFSASLPDKASFKIFVVSQYLNERNSDSRNDFEILEGLKSADLLNPISISMIKKESISVLNEIINEKYPNLLDSNRKEIDKAIDEAPQLKKYILRNDDVLKDSKSLVKKATKQYLNEKKDLNEKYEKIIKSSTIDYDDFKKTIDEMSDIAAIELAQYIVYRDKIIGGLEKVVHDRESLEKDIHNLIMKRFTQSNSDDDYLNRNLWILDDKFMTYQYAASDMDINNICEQLNKTEPADPSKRRPDLFIGYNKKSGAKDAVVVELKGANAPIDEKCKSFREITENINLIRNNIPDVQTVYGYIITKIDDAFAKTIELDDRFIELMTEDSDNRIYYGYLKKVNAHVYIADIEVIINNAKLRNETFIKILKKHS